ATAQIRGLQQRLERAQKALDKLAAKPGEESEELNLKVEAILKRHRVKEFFCVSLSVETYIQNRYMGPGRPIRNSVKEEVTKIRLHLQIEQDAHAIEQAKQLAGWR
ncbi:IS1634 family transposase, partial [Acaryochloris marina NIES-2412]